MQIHKGIQLNQSIKNAVVTSGTFDGVHLGHQYILNTLSEEARKVNGESVILTFWPHPKMVLNPQSEVKLITELEEKLELLEQFNIDHVWIIPFDRTFSLLSSNDFIQKILIDSLNTKKLIIGYDHKFGKNREGSFDYLVKNKALFPFEIQEIERQSTDEITFSSTLIRKHLTAGEIEPSNELLGHNYTLSGTVVKGFQNGRKIGFPTANIQINFDQKLIPGDGSYIVKVHLNNGLCKFGMLNIGTRPTMQTGRSIEVHLFNFDQDIYGENLKIEFFKKIREEKHFKSIELLQEQLKLDEKTSRLYFNI